MNLTAVVVAALVFVCPAFAYAAPRACSCKHLEAIQQELKNAIYLAKFQADMAKAVEKAEKEQKELREKNPSHPLARRSVRKASEIEWENQRAKIQLPFPNVTGYTGPNSVGLVTGTCTNVAADLKALAAGASCKEIGMITLKHEEEHRNLCTNMGVGPYWDRLYSEIAKEEADRYKAQAKALRELLKKVIDAATVKVSEETDLTITSGPTENKYRISTPAFKLSGKSSPGKDDWELTGKGKRTVAVTSVKLPGMTCTPPAQKLASKITGTLKLDGLTMRLDETSVSEGGTLSMTCQVPGKGQGIGVGVAPPGDTGSGEVFKDEDVRRVSDFTEDIAKSPWGKAINQTGVVATGTQKVKLEITCQ